MSATSVTRAPPAAFGSRTTKTPREKSDLPPELVNRLSSELQLDSSQQAQLKKILDERRERLDTVHREARERFDKEQRDLHAAIRAMLRADQQERFDRFLDRRR